MVTNTLTLSPQKSTLRVRLIPELNTWAIRNHRDRQLWLYYLLRALTNYCEAGSGKLDLEVIKDFLVGQLKLYNPLTLKHHLALGMGKWWTQYENRFTGRTVITILALKKVCEYSTIQSASFIDIPIGKIPPSRALAARRALLYNTGAYKPMLKKANPISRKSLEEKTGIYRRKQQRYDNIAETQRKETQVMWRDPETHKLRHAKQLIMTRYGPVNINKQKGNVYHSHADLSNRGMTRKIAKAVRNRQGSLLADEAPTKKPLAKCYWSSFKDYLKAYLKGKTGNEGYYPLKRNDLVLVECIIW